MFKIVMNEPQRGYEFLRLLVELGEKYPQLAAFYPIGADIFVFVYPIFLTAVYLYGIIKKELEAKKEALFIFFACLFSVLANILSQQFFDKQRPIYTFGIQNMDQETLLHQFLPSTSFPSDHAVVTFSIAMATWLIAHKHENKKLKIWSGFLFFFAIITGLCRIGTTVHRTTDILAGMIMGILIPTVLMLPFCFKTIEKRLLLPIIRFEEWTLAHLYSFFFPTKKRN